MGYYLNSEKSIISHFQGLESSSVCFPVESEEAIKVFELIHNLDNWKLWIESSGKSDPPPDFYSDEYKCMMDVMRVDDHSYKNKKGKLVNPTNRHIRDMEKEILQSGIMEMCPNAELFINGITDLPTHEDHNYNFYLKNFERVILQHIQKIPLYKKNHPFYDVVFFIMDESSAYIEAADKKCALEDKRAGQVLAGYPHLYFIDSNFVRIFEGSGIDYVIWFTPFKYCEIAEGQLDLPKACVFDIKKFSIQTEEYDAERMMSAEA